MINHNIKLVLFLFITIGIFSFLLTSCDNTVDSDETEEVDSFNSCDPNSSVYSPEAVLCNSVSPHCPSDFPYTCGDSTRCFRFPEDCREAGECCPITSGNNVNPNNWVPKN